MPPPTSSQKHNNRLPPTTTAKYQHHNTSNPNHEDENNLTVGKEDETNVPPNVLHSNNKSEDNLVACQPQHEEKSKTNRNLTTGASINHVPPLLSNRSNIISMQTPPSSSTNVSPRLHSLSNNNKINAATTTTTDRMNVVPATLASTDTTPTSIPPSTQKSVESVPSHVRSATIAVSAITATSICSSTVNKQPLSIDVTTSTNNPTTPTGNTRLPKPLPNTNSPKTSPTVQGSGIVPQHVRSYSTLISGSSTPPNPSKTLGKVLPSTPTNGQTSSPNLATPPPMNHHVRDLSTSSSPATSSTGASQENSPSITSPSNRATSPNSKQRNRKATVYSSSSSPQQRTTSVLVNSSSKFNTDNNVASTTHKEDVNRETITSNLAETKELEKFLQNYFHVSDIDNNQDAMVFDNLTQIARWINFERYFELISNWYDHNVKACSPSSHMNNVKHNRFLMMEVLGRRCGEITNYLEKQKRLTLLSSNLTKSFNFILDKLSSLSATERLTSIVKKEMIHVMWCLMKIDEISLEGEQVASSSIAPIIGSMSINSQHISQIEKSITVTTEQSKPLPALPHWKTGNFKSNPFLQSLQIKDEDLGIDTNSNGFKSSSILPQAATINTLIDKFERKTAKLETKIADKGDKALSTISGTLKNTIEYGQEKIKSVVTKGGDEQKPVAPPKQRNMDPERRNKILSGYFNTVTNTAPKRLTPPKREKINISEIHKFNFLLEFADNQLLLPVVSQPLIAPEKTEISRSFSTVSRGSNRREQSMESTDVNQKIIEKINNIDNLSKQMRNALLYSTVCTTALSSLSTSQIDASTKKQATNAINEFCDEIIGAITKSLSTSQQKDILNKHLKLMDPSFQKKVKLLKTFINYVVRNKTFNANQQTSDKEPLSFNGTEAISIISNLIMKKVVKTRQRKSIIGSDKVSDTSRESIQATSVPVVDIDPEQLRTRALTFMQEILQDEIIYQKTPKIKHSKQAKFAEDQSHIYGFCEDHLLYSLVNQEREMEEQLDETEDELAIVLSLINLPFFPLLNLEAFKVTDSQTFVLYKHRKVLCKEPKLFMYIMRSINWKGDYHTGVEVLELMVKDIQNTDNPFSPLRKISSMHVLFLMYETAVQSKVDLEIVQIFAAEVFKRRSIYEIELLLPQIFYCLTITKFYNYIFEFLLESCDKSEYVFNKLNWMLTSMLTSNTLSGGSGNQGVNSMYKQLQFRMIQKSAQSKEGKYNLDQFLRQQKLVDNMLVISEYIKTKLGKELSLPRPQKILQLKSLLASQKLPYLLNSKQISMTNLEDFIKNEFSAETLKIDQSQVSPRSYAEIQSIAKLLAEDSKLKFIDFLVEQDRDFHEWNNEVFPIDTVPCLDINEKFPDIKEQLMISGFVPNDGYIFKSAQEPVCFPFSIQSFSNENAAEFKLIFKQGDDLRQDEYILQLFSLMNRIMKQNGINLEIITYHCVATSQSPLNSGFVEMVSQTSAVSAILANYKTIFNFIRETSLKKTPSTNSTKSVDASKHVDFYTFIEDSEDNTPVIEYQPSPGEVDMFLFEEKLHKYIRSLAGYSIFTYLLAIGDRHLDNLLMKESGELFHIDFGFVLSEDPKPYLGTPPMRISREMVADFSEEHLNAFRMYCCQTFKILRKYAGLIIYMLLWISVTNMDTKEQATIKCVDKLGLISDKVSGKSPSLSLHNPLKQFSIKNITTIQNNFRLDLKEDELDDFVKKLIDQSLNMLGPKVNEEIHKIAMKLRE